jgi:hypothetical protein
MARISALIYSLRCKKSSNILKMSENAQFARRYLLRPGKARNLADSKENNHRDFKAYHGADGIDGVVSDPPKTTDLGCFAPTMN